MPGTLSAAPKAASGVTPASYTPPAGSYSPSTNNSYTPPANNYHTFDRQQRLYAAGQQQLSASRQLSTCRQQQLHAAERRLRTIGRRFGNVDCRLAAAVRPAHETGDLPATAVVGVSLMSPLFSLPSLPSSFRLSDWPGELKVPSFRRSDILSDCVGLKRTGRNACPPALL